MLAVVKDTGGMEAVLPVVRAIRRSGADVHLIANGVSVDFLSRQAEPFTVAEDAENALGQFDYPQLLLTSMCSDGGVGRDLVPLMRAHGVPTVAVQCQWGGRLLTDWRDERYRPDFIVVNDDVAADIVQRAWADFPRSRIKVLGYARLDAYASIDVAAMSRRVRTDYGLDDRPVVYFSGQLPGTDVALRNLVWQISDMHQSIQLIVGLHPRTLRPETEARWPGLAARIREELECARTLETAGHRVIESMPVSEVDIACASDVVVSMYGTALTDAAVLRKSAIADFSSDAGKKWYPYDTGGLMTVHPLVELGCVEAVTCPKEYASALHRALAGQLAEELRPAQERYIRVDGGNAQRIASFCLSLIV